MSGYWMVDFKMTDGEHQYVLREWDGERTAPKSLVNPVSEPIGAGDCMDAGDRVIVEDFGPKCDGPFRTLALMRTSDGWIEAEVLSVLE